MKKLPYFLVLSASLAGCGNLELTADTSDKDEKMEITGSLIPRKRPIGVEIIGKEGFEKAMDDAKKANGLLRNM